MHPSSPKLSAWLTRGLLGAAALLTASAALAQPRWVRLSYEGDAATAVTVSWNTDAATDPEFVRFGPTDSYGTQVAATEAPIPLQGSLGFVHQVQLTGLSPDSAYHYSVGGPGAWSADAILRTAPADRCSPLRFVALGDGRSQDDSGVDAKWHEILQDAVANDPLFILDTGDLVKDGSDDPQWVDWLQETDAFNPYYPHQPSIGNHDDDSVTGDGAMYNDIFALSRNAATGTEDFYYFTAGDAIFVAISSTTYNDDGFAQQAAWLDGVLTANADKRWKFVWMHHPPYTSHANFFGIEFNHAPNEVGQNAALVPIFDKHHVDMVFAGHNHYYERFDPLIYNPSDPEQGTVASGFDTGTTYVITGGAGAFTYDAFDIGGTTIDLIDWVCGPLTAARGSALCSGKHHYVVVDIDDNVLTFEAITTRKQNFTDETPFTIETFQIVKPDLGPCSTTGTDGGSDGGADGGVTDAGPDGGGTPDAGPDAGVPPDGGPDAGTPPDGGDPDAGVRPDGGTGPDPDAGSSTDAGGGSDGGGSSATRGCGCQSGGRDALPASVFVLALALLGIFGSARRRSAV